jgi:hypothetical protein
MCKVGASFSRTVMRFLGCARFAGQHEGTGCNSQENQNDCHLRGLRAQCSKLGAIAIFNHAFIFRRRGALGKSTSAAEFIVIGPTPPEKQNGKLRERDSIGPR